MKNTNFIVVLILILTLTSLHVGAQDVGVKKYELGINLYNITDYGWGSAFWYEDDQNSFDNRFFTGVMFKRNWSKSALRVSLDYTYRSKVSEDYRTYDNTTYINEGIVDKRQDFLRIENRTGYQRQFLVVKGFIPYVAVDLISGVDMYSTTFTAGELTPDDANKEYTSTAIRVGGSLALGFKYQISNRFSANIETSLESVRNYIIVPENVVSRGQGLIFNPIRLLSVNYHF